MKGKPKRRARPLQLTTGTPPARLDIGSEAGFTGVTQQKEEAESELEKWTFNMKGYMRVPFRVGYGPRNDGTEGNELHVPPRMVGLSSGDWEYLAIAQNPAISIYANFGNPIVSANIIWGSSALTDPGYDNLDSLNGLRQAYVTLKYPEAFGRSGGLALTAGAFSNRYGSAGRQQVNSGFYGTYLFGRTHAAGEVLTAGIDLSKDLELILEHGVGARLEGVPFLQDSPRTPDGSPEADFIQGTGQSPQGSNFLHHAHAALVMGEWRFAAHYLTSWSPDDNSFIRGIPAEESRMTVTGAEVHYDQATANGFIGFSHVDAKNLIPLGNAVQVLHGSDGRGFKEEYFGEKDRVANFRPSNDDGTVDTLLFQYTTNVSPYTEVLPLGAREMYLGIYSMLNHAVSEKTDPDDPLQLEINSWMMKFGGIAQLDMFKWLVVGLRADHVQPCMSCRRGAPDADGVPSFVSDSSDAFTALTPHILLHTQWKLKEWVYISYTHFFMGPRVYPSSPYSDYTQADPHMFNMMIRMTF